MRIIHIAPTPFGPGGLFGGGERYPYELARALATEVDCTLLTFGRHPSQSREPGGLHVHTLRALTFLRGHPAHPVTLSLPARLRHADLVHTHHMRSLPSRLAALTVYARRRPVVVTDHGLQGGDWAGLLPRLFARFLAVSAYSAPVLRAPPARTRLARRMGRNARELVLERFTWRACAERCLAAYGELVTPTGEDA